MKAIPFPFNISFLIPLGFWNVRFLMVAPEYLSLKFILLHKEDQSTRSALLYINNIAVFIFLFFSFFSRYVNKLIHKLQLQQTITTITIFYHIILMLVWDGVMSILYPRSYIQGLINIRYYSESTGVHVDSHAS